METVWATMIEYSDSFFLPNDDGNDQSLHKNAPQRFVFDDNKNNSISTSTLQLNKG